MSDYRDKNGELIFEGRFNLGAVSLNLPMIYMKAKKEKLDYYETLNYYLELIRKLHIKRFEYVGKAKANSNPLMFTQGGAYGGYLNPEDDIKPLLKSATISFGITALHELCLIHNKKPFFFKNSCYKYSKHEPMNKKSLLVFDYFIYWFSNGFFTKSICIFLYFIGLVIIFFNLVSLPFLRFS